MTAKALERIEELGVSLAKRESCLALLGLGSVGKELKRCDEYSDLDFFVIVREGSKMDYLNDLDWLNEVKPLVYSFRNTVDGYKVLFNDGVYGEFAVFEEREMNAIGYSEGRFIFRKDGCHVSEQPVVEIREIKEDNIDFALNELLTNLLVGMQRYRRGERLAAQRLIEYHAVNRLLSIYHHFADEENDFVDAYNLERRVEFRFPTLANLLPSFVQGIDRVPSSAKALLDFTLTLGMLNEAMVKEIEALL
ncbi:MAG: hypothetical protein A2Y20_10610 [Firmicutes bacterium GWF2_51_9]|nr:MAG: hypothetical protein A2Y20_10610 [Firmicutes bacterium GWF2_51_9]OGS59465.1 MAG: hypothetical protein A2Y19_10805 [Firmicutes bacterium GWE2_51_13]HAM62821.1 hypothetical protein [Erysipelotrichaceae bacterium]HBZ41087.1 hypothetical protein [Erysipelotrichaceae bacterium]